MILIKEIEIKGNGKTMQYYKDRGYDIKWNVLITIKVEDLIETSAIKIDCLCDVCQSINNIKYFNYVGNIKRNGLYRCNECSKEVRSSKIKQLHQDSEASLNILNKTRQTNIEKYGVDNYTKTEEYRIKTISTNLKKYGTEVSSKNQNVKNKMYATNIERYGCQYTFHNTVIKNKIKETILDKFGVDNAFKNEEVKNKIKNTLIKRYGVDNPMKDIEIFDKAQKNSYKIVKHNNINITYQGTYELDFIEYCMKNDIIFEKGPTVDYVLDGISRKYHSDFYIPDLNLICEIKSNWTYNRDLEENLAKKLFCEKIGYNFLFIIDKNYSDLSEKILPLQKISNN